MHLDERKMKILKVIISTYLETGEPVGSRTIAKDSDLHLSSATIRNEMADLEELGYILQPHTSAGRIPSDLGYRYYVDHLLEEKENEMIVRENELRKEQQELLQKMDRMEEVLKRVADVLAADTNYATLVTTPQIKESKLKFIQLSMVDSRRLLAVIVVGNDTVKNLLMNIDEPLSNDEILKLNILLNSFLQGLTLNEINLELVHTMKVQAGMHAGILEGIFNGLGDTKAPFFFSIFTMWGVRILGTCFCMFMLHGGLEMVWICMVADNVTRCLLLGTRFLRGSWKKKFIRRG